jgi:hypothetical protein
MFAATEVTAITATPSPTCRLRADAKNEPTAAITTRALQGLRSPTMPLSRSSVNALMATSEIPKPRPAAAPSRTPCCALTRSMRCEKIRTSPSAMPPPSKRISAVNE